MRRGPLGALAGLLLLSSLVLWPGLTHAQTTEPLTLTASTQAAGAAGVSDTFTVTFDSSSSCAWSVNGATLDAPANQDFAGVTSVEWVGPNGNAYGTYTPLSVSASAVTFSSGASPVCEGDNGTNQFILSGVANTATPGTGTASAETFDGTTPETIGSASFGTYNGITLSGGASGLAPFAASPSLTVQLTANGSAVDASGVSVSVSLEPQSLPVQNQYPYFWFNGDAYYWSGTIPSSTTGSDTFPVTDGQAPDVLTVTASVPAASGTYTASQTLSWTTPVATFSGGGTGPPITVSPTGPTSVSETLPAVSFTNNSQALSPYLELQGNPATATPLAGGATFDLPWTLTPTSFSSGCAGITFNTSTLSMTTTSQSDYLASDESLVTSASGCSIGLTATVTDSWTVAAGTYMLSGVIIGTFP